MEDRIKLIHSRLQALQPVSLEIIDESHHHIGHAGSKNGAGHYRVVIQSAAFNGQTPLNRQRQVYNLLNDLMPYPIHALAISAKPTN